MGGRDYYAHKVNLNLHKLNLIYLYMVLAALAS